MKFIFPILSIVVCAAAIYFSLSGMEKFETTQQTRLAAKTTNANVTKNLAEATLAITEEEKLLKAAQDQLATDTASVSFLESSIGNLKKEVVALNATLGELTKESVEEEEGLEQFNIVFDGEDGNVTRDNFQAKFNAIEDDVKGKQARLDEMDTLLEGARASFAAKQADLERVVERIRSRNKRIAMNAMEARITAVNQEWGFLVIGAGSNSGFNPQTTLLVKRDGRLIGKVKPSAIEPTQTIAEIDPKSLAPGVRIQPGDRVILAKPARN